MTTADQGARGNLIETTETALNTPIIHQRLECLFERWQRSDDDDDDGDHDILRDRFLNRPR